MTEGLTINHSRYSVSYISIVLSGVQVGAPPGPLCFNTTGKYWTPQFTVHMNVWKAREVCRKETSDTLVHLPASTPYNNY